MTALWAGILVLALVGAAVVAAVLTRRHRTNAPARPSQAFDATHIPGPHDTSPTGAAVADRPCVPAAAHIAGTPGEPASESSVAPEFFASDVTETSGAPDSQLGPSGYSEGGGAVPCETILPGREGDGTAEDLHGASPPVGEDLPTPPEPESVQTPGPRPDLSAKASSEVHVDARAKQDEEPASQGAPGEVADQLAMADARSASHEGSDQEAAPPGPATSETAPSPTPVAHEPEDPVVAAHTPHVADGQPAAGAPAPDLQGADGHLQDGTSQAQDAAAQTAAGSGGGADEKADTGPSRGPSTLASDGESPQPAPVCEAATGTDEEAGAASAGEPSEDAKAAEPGSSASGRTRGRSRADKPVSPRQYRPPTRALTAPGTSGTATAGNGLPRERAFRMEVRLLFEHGGFARLSLLPQREPSLPEELPVSGEGDPPALLALQDEWYQDIVVPDMSSVLRRGLVWQCSIDGQAVRWSLSGREVYVLGRHNSLNGYVSKPRLEIGEDQIVLCTENRRQSVLEAVRLTGSPDPAILTCDLGVPVGWVALKGVLPKSPVPPRNDGDILEVLRPLANVEIVFDGGIRLFRTSWLAGYPPRIRLKGMAEDAGRVHIDGAEAASLSDGSFTAPGWDHPGTHEVWCHSASKSYSLEPGADGWEAWNAYRWSHGDERGQDRPQSPAICGMMVRPPEDCGGGSHSVTVPAAEPLFIGAEPGQIRLCAVRGDLRGADCMAFLTFEPVWGLPADPWRCDKRTARIVLVGGQPVGSFPRRCGNKRGQLIDEWCGAILAASRKGLLLSVADERALRLWQGYRRVARQIWRSRR